MSSRSSLLTVSLSFLCPQSREFVVPLEGGEKVSGFFCKAGLWKCRAFAEGNLLLDHEYLLLVLFSLDSFCFLRYYSLEMTCSARDHKADSTYTPPSTDWDDSEASLAHLAAKAAAKSSTSTTSTTMTTGGGASGDAKSQQAAMDSLWEDNWDDDDVDEDFNNKLK